MGKDYQLMLKRDTMHLLILTSFIYGQFPGAGAASLRAVKGFLRPPSLPENPASPSYAPQAPPQWIPLSRSNGLQGWHIALIVCLTVGSAILVSLIVLFLMLRDLKRYEKFEDEKIQQRLKDDSIAAASASSQAKDSTHPSQGNLAIRINEQNDEVYGSLPCENQPSHPSVLISGPDTSKNQPSFLISGPDTSALIFNNALADNNLDDFDVMLPLPQPLTDPGLQPPMLPLTHQHLLATPSAGVGISAQSLISGGASAQEPVYTNTSAPTVPDSEESPQAFTTNTNSTFQPLRHRGGGHASSDSDSDFRSGAVAGATVSNTMPQPNSRNIRNERLRIYDSKANHLPLKALQEHSEEEPEPVQILSAQIQRPADGTSPPTTMTGSLGELKVVSVDHDASSSNMFHVAVLDAGKHTTVSLNGNDDEEDFGESMLPLPPSHTY